MINYEVQFSINKMLKDENKKRNIDLFVLKKKAKRKKFIAMNCGVKKWHESIKVNPPNR